MFTTLRLPLLLVATLTGALLFTTSAKADHYDHRFDSLDNLATRLERESRTLAIELRRVGFADANLRQAAREVSVIAREASHIHSIIHHGASLDHLHADMLSLQNAVHHLEEHLAPYHHFADHVETIDDLTHAIDDALHALEHRHTVRRPVYGYGPSHGNGVTFGNGNFSVRIGR